ncbi:hypothetical protein GDO78_020216 [Eleutherodactylus coqui]|uniref:Uncharacterized protein n=1 Tax=Eleutherodactylus coqui TaxID=57060 RepID=A0A8J6BFY2_ELECQ|nr:hypothetical protein GDO78_020216 [Eleutherodactylus coqui]
MTPRQEASPLVPPFLGGFPLWVLPGRPLGWLGATPVPRLVPKLTSLQSGRSRPTHCPRLPFGLCPGTPMRKMLEGTHGEPGLVSQNTGTVKSALLYGKYAWTPWTHESHESPWTVWTLRV